MLKKILCLLLKLLPNGGKYSCTALAHRHFLCLILLSTIAVPENCITTSYFYAILYDQKYVFTFFWNIFFWLCRYSYILTFMLYLQ